MEKITTKKQFAACLLAAIAFVITMGFTACSSSSDDDTKDMEYPEITTQGITANPINCQVYHPGETIAFCYAFRDNMELGKYNIEIHQNSDHHSHSTEADDHDHDADCEDGDHDHEHEHDADNAGKSFWVFNQSYDIPTGQRSYTARVDIKIPDDIATGDYHFMIRLTDRAGFQQIKAVAIKIEKE